MIVFNQQVMVWRRDVESPWADLISICRMRRWQWSFGTEDVREVTDEIRGNMQYDKKSRIQIGRERTYQRRQTFDSTGRCADRYDTKRHMGFF
jgi:hypothetical protein